MQERSFLETFCKILCLEQRRKPSPHGETTKRRNLEEWDTQTGFDYIPETPGSLEHSVQRPDISEKHQ